MSQKRYIIEVEKAKEASDGRPSMGPVYRSLFAKDGFPPPTQGLDTCWDVFRLSYLRFTLLHFDFGFYIVNFISYCHTCGPSTSLLYFLSVFREFEFRATSYFLLLLVSNVFPLILSLYAKQNSFLLMFDSF